MAHSTDLCNILVEDLLCSFFFFVTNVFPPYEETYTPKPNSGLTSMHMLMRTSSSQWSLLLLKIWLVSTDS